MGRPTRRVNKPAGRYVYPTVCVLNLKDDQVLDAIYTDDQVLDAIIKEVKNLFETKSGKSRLSKEINYSYTKRSYPLAHILKKNYLRL
jgi:hypothetical protein